MSVAGQIQQKVPPPDVPIFQSHTRAVLLSSTPCDRTFPGCTPSVALSLLATGDDEVIIHVAPGTCAHIVRLSLCLFPTEKITFWDLKM